MKIFSSQMTLHSCDPRLRSFKSLLSCIINGIKDLQPKINKENKNHLPISVKVALKLSKTALSLWGTDHLGCPMVIVDA